MNGISFITPNVSCYTANTLANWWLYSVRQTWNIQSVIAGDVANWWVLYKTWCLEGLVYQPLICINTNSPPVFHSAHSTDTRHHWFHTLLAVWLHICSAFLVAVNSQAPYNVLQMAYGLSLWIIVVRYSDLNNKSL